MKSIYKICFILFIVPLTVFATKPNKKHEKTRTIKKEYSVDSDAKLAIRNKYGDVNITTWDKNIVDIKVIITVKGEDLDDVEERLNNIDIEFNANNKIVTATTNLRKLKRRWSLWGSNNNINYKINYIVKMPKTNDADLKNEYGSIFLGNLSGNATIYCDYGKIVVDQLLGDYNLINLDYCSSSSVNFIKNGALNIDYSKLVIENSEKIKINSDYTTLSINKTKDINFNTGYGSLKITDAENVTGNSDYTNMRFETIRKNLNIDTDYGSIGIKNLLSNFETVDINATYTGIKIGVKSDAVFNFEIDLQYANFNEDDQMEIFKKVEKSTSKYYEGKFGKGNTNSKIKIRSDYGGVNIKSN